MDLKSILDQCVKCGSKFTTPERPLKLLPCLHSMCLDCLYGRMPSRSRSVKDSTDEKEKENQDCSSSVPGLGSDETNSSSEKLQENTNENSDTKKSEENGEKLPEPDKTKEIDDSDSVPESFAKQSPEPATEGQKKDDEERPNDVDETSSLDKNDTTVTSSDADESATKDVPSSSSETPISESKDNESEECQSQKTEQEAEEEEHDIKPKPVTECPVCRDPIEQPGASLMDNMFASLDPDQEDCPQADTKHTCTGCEDGQEAASYCLQCEEWLCDNCVDAHKRVRVTKDHTISPKDEVKVVTSKSPWEQLMLCKQHRQEPLKFFCEKCEKLTCRDCQLLDHKEHKYQFLDQAAEQYKARLKGSLALMGEKRAKLASSRDEIEQKLHNCKEQKDNLQQEILKQADILVKGIRQAVWGVLSNLASFTDAATKRLNKEIDDVSELVSKFDHCVQFMEDILKEGSSMSLLYSKGNVETKCRKVYHTQVDPQSLKGTLLIQYKHDVNWLLQNLNKIGSIFVNGVRYPPDKNGQAARQAAYQEQRAGMSATSPHLQHMANQAIPGQRVPSDWSKFIQTVSKPSIPPNMTMTGLGSAASLPPQLTLPSNRRTQGSSSSAISQQWQASPPVIPGSTFPGHFVAGQLLTPQQQNVRPAFTPMRLHHRPATQSSFPGQGEHRSQSLRSPPQYRMGGEASGTPRSSHSTPDPARPASAGMYDGNARPDSGGSAMVDVKKERRDHSPDCVIMSSSMKTERPAFHTSPSIQSETALEMQRNLDEVLRAVPMDMSDNLEQISGVSKSRPRSGDGSHSSSTSAAPPPQLPPPSTTPSSTTASQSPQVETSQEGATEGPQSPTDQELRENWQGGNSMPGFSLSQADVQGDPNDDYCAVCHNGGDVLCCDICPKVFHLQCHVPELSAVPSGSFVCTFCDGDKPVSTEEINSNGKRKHPGGISDSEVKVCERILLELFCHPSSVPFQEPVNKEQVPNYYKIITQPVDFTQIKGKLSRSHQHHYQSIKSFLYDLRQVFINCAIYNKAGSEVGKAGKIVRGLMESLVERLIPQYLSFVKENPSPMFSALQRKLDADMANEDSNNAVSSPKRPKVDE